MKAVGTAALLLWPAATLALDCPGTVVEVPAGVMDGFALPVELAVPAPDYAAFLANFWVGQGHRDFDQAGLDLALPHTFPVTTDVCGAELELRLRAEPDVLANNDSIRLDYTGSNVPETAHLWWRTIRTFTGGSWMPGDEATLVLDLTDLPERDGVTNVLPGFADGDLDLMVEDDTRVDYALLRLCLCAVTTERLPWGRVKAVYR